jgi:hypothetical protein
MKQTEKMHRNILGAFRGRLERPLQSIPIGKRPSSGAFFWARFARPKKPGFPLQVLGFAYANPVGFPLQSLAPHGLSDTEKANRKNHTVINCV